MGLCCSKPARPEHQGAWSSAVAEQVAAGLLLTVDLGGTTMQGGAKEAAEFVKAFGSAQCRVRGALGMQGMALSEAGGAVMVGEMLQGNRTLTSIDLSINSLGEVGGAAIGAALTGNTTLTSIDLSINNLGEVGGAAIGAALTGNTTLTSIDLSMNKLGEVAGATLAEALTVNTTLTSIDLDANDALPAATRTAIEAAVARNKAAAE